MRNLTFSDFWCSVHITKGPFHPLLNGHYENLSAWGATANLKNIDVEIPRNTLTVITGLSGSGKSSLAFDTIYAEGQRRNVETLSAYARQFLDQMERPDVDSIDGLSPAISISRSYQSAAPGQPWGRLRRFTTTFASCSLLWGLRIAPTAVGLLLARLPSRLCSGSWP